MPPLTECDHRGAKWCRQYLHCRILLEQLRSGRKVAQGLVSRCLEKAGGYLFLVCSFGPSLTVGCSGEKPREFYLGLTMSRIPSSLTGGSPGYWGEWGGATGGGVGVPGNRQPFILLMTTLALLNRGNTGEQLGEGRGALVTFGCGKRRELCLK